MNEITNKTIVEKILDILEKPHSMIEYVGDRPGHDKRYSIDCSKIENQTGWRPQYNFDDALKQTVTWYLDNQSWWKSLIDDEYITCLNLGLLIGNEISSNWICWTCRFSGSKRFGTTKSYSSFLLS